MQKIIDETPLRYKTISSLVSSYAIETFGQFILIASKLILARLLLPEVFGVFAVSFALLNIAKGIISLGLGRQFIRQKEVYYGDCLLAECALSLITIAAIWVLSPLLKFYDTKVIAVNRILALSLIPYCLNFVPQVYAFKELEIKKMLLPNILGLAFYACTAIILAYLKKGIWALVYAQIAQESVLVFYMWRKFYPYINLDFSKDRVWIFKTIWNAKYLYIISLTAIFLGGLDKVILGKYVNATVVGFYSMALTLVFTPVGMIENALNSVFYPLFSKIKDEIDKVRSIYKDITMLLYSIEVPLYAFVFFNADIITHILLGQKWTGASLYLKWMAIFPIFFPWNTFGIQIMTAKHKEYIELITTTISLFFLILLGIFLTKRYDGVGMLVTCYILHIFGVPFTYFVNKITGNIIKITIALFPIYLFSFLLLAVPSLIFNDILRRSLTSFALLILLYSLFFNKIWFPVLCKYYGKDKLNFHLLFKQIYKRKT